MRHFALTFACLAFSIAAIAQTPAPAAASALPTNQKGQSPDLPKVAPGDGIPLPVISNVSSNVTVDAILLPASVSRRIFGKEVSDHYAVVEIIIGNHSSSAALIVQTAMLDYSHWLFSNNFQLDRNLSITTTDFQAANRPNQIASAEARLVRGELQDAQLWTFRNSFIRAATLVGAVASGYQFLASSQNYLSGIDAFGNQVVPALATFWPDRTQLQINRISDFGFQNNHVVAKGASDTIVAFFPIDRFLTPGLRKIFIKSPAVFYVPGSMLLDKKYTHTLAEMLRNTGLVTDANDTDAVAKVGKAFAHYENYRVTNDPNILTPDEKVLLFVLDKISLNNIRVIVGGIMTIDTNAVPATIDSIAFATPPTWKKDSVVTGFITGSFLSDGVASILDSTGAAVGDVTVDPKTSTDTKLAFSLKFSKDLTTDTKLEFTVTKTATDKSQTVSKKFEYSLADQKPVLSGPPTFTPEDIKTAAAWKNGATLHATLTGSFLSGVTPSVVAPAANHIGAMKVDTANSTDTNLVFTFPLTADVPSGTKLQFLVTKKAADGSPISSDKKELDVTYPAAQ